MPPLRVPESIADQMVEILFADVRLPCMKQIQCHECGEGELIAAVHRYFDDQPGSPPSGGPSKLTRNWQRRCRTGSRTPSESVKPIT